MIAAASWQPAQTDKCVIKRSWSSSPTTTTTTTTTTIKNTTMIMLCSIDVIRLDNLQLFSAPDKLILELQEFAAKRLFPEPQKSILEPGMHGA